LEISLLGELIKRWDNRNNDTTVC